MKKILDVSHGTLDNNFFEVLLATTRIVQNGSGRFSMDQNVYFRQFDITVQVTHRKKRGVENSNPLLLLPYNGRVSDYCHQNNKIRLRELIADVNEVQN